jgi:hypothetical protein
LAAPPISEKWVVDRIGVDADASLCPAGEHRARAVTAPSGPWREQRASERLAVDLAERSKLLSAMPRGLVAWRSTPRARAVNNHRPGAPIHRGGGVGGRISAPNHSTMSSRSEV